MTNASMQEIKFSYPENSLHDALLWAAMGRPVFPIWPIDPDTLNCTCPLGEKCTDKHPILKGGHINASTDPKKIRQMWKRALWRMRKVLEEQGRPDKGLQPAIGGGTQGLIVLDIDSAEGYERWASVAAGRAPSTMTTASGRFIDDNGLRGAHIAFRIPDNLDPAIRDRLTIWGNGNLDGRANGKGWTVLPPSLHRSGERYLVTNPVEVAEAPGWLIEFALAQIANGRGKPKKTGSAGAISTGDMLRMETEPTPHPDSLWYGMGLGVLWKPSTQNERDCLLAALEAADPECTRAAAGRPSIERLRWLGVIWSLRAHERFWRDGFAHTLALTWSRQFASHEDESFYRTVWEREPDANYPHVGKQRIYDLADAQSPGWRDALVKQVWVDQPSPSAYEHAANGGLGAVGAYPSGTGTAAPGMSQSPGRPDSAPAAGMGGAGGGMGGAGSTNGGAEPPRPSDGPALVLSKTTPSRSAELFRDRYFPTLMRSNGDFLTWKDGAYVVMEEDTVRSHIQVMLDRAMSTAEDKETGERVNVPFNPKSKDVAEVESALKNKQHVMRTDRPKWLNGHVGPKPENIISFPNCLLDSTTGATYPQTPNFFTRNAREFIYDADAPHPEKSLAFFRQIFAGEECEERIRLFRQMLGLLISGDISFHKIFMILGPRRSGKSTLSKVITALVGAASVASTTFSSLSKDFGLQSIIGASVALIPDAHMGSKTDRDVVVEVLKSVSGGDMVTARRKYLTDWKGVMDARFVIIANAMPDLADASAALASRIVALQTTTSFEGRERRGLFEEDILPELPGLMKWALEGLADLRNEGQFSLTASAKDLRDSMATANNPVLAFIQDRCEFAEGARVAKSDLYSAYRQWCFENGEREISAIRFGKLLFSASGGRISGVGKRQNVKTQNAEGKLVDAYEGIKLFP